MKIQVTTNKKYKNCRNSIKKTIKLTASSPVAASCFLFLSRFDFGDSVLDDSLSMSMGGATTRAAVSTAGSAAIAFWPDMMFAIF